MTIQADEFKTLYQELKNISETTLKGKVRLPSEESKAGKVLIFLYKNIGQKVSKSELTDFMKNFYPDTVDVQQARHLSLKDGWNILSGSRGDSNLIDLKTGDYCLLNITDAYPVKNHRKSNIKTNSFQEKKIAYNFRCATCNSLEGKPHFKYPTAITKLEQGHMDPNKDLTLENCIPQCQYCNKVYKNKFVFDANGLVKSPANHKFVLDLPLDEQRLAFEELKKLFT